MYVQLERNSSVNVRGLLDQWRRIDAVEERGERSEEYVWACSGVLSPGLVGAVHTPEHLARVAAAAAEAGVCTAKFTNNSLPELYNSLRL